MFVFLLYVHNDHISVFHSYFSLVYMYNRLSPCDPNGRYLNIFFNKKTSE